MFKPDAIGRKYIQDCRKPFEKSNFMMMPDDSNFESIDWLMMIKNDFEKIAKALAFDWKEKRDNFAETIKDLDLEKG